MTLQEPAIGSLAIPGEFTQAKKKGRQHLFGTPSRLMIVEREVEVEKAKDIRFCGLKRFSTENEGRHRTDGLVIAREGNIVHLQVCEKPGTIKASVVHARHHAIATHVVEPVCIKLA